MSESHSPQKPAKAAKVALWTLTGCQLLIVAIFALGDIGFDHPGRYGLDFGDALILMVLQVVLFLAAGVIIVKKRFWHYLFAELLLFLLTFLSIMAP